MWTIERVKDELPSIDIKFGDGMWSKGIITGRKCSWATVYTTKGTSKDWVAADYAWETIVGALQANRPLVW